MAHWETKTLKLPCYDYTISESSTTSNLDNMKTYADSNTTASLDVTRGHGTSTEVCLYFDFTDILGKLTPSKINIKSISMSTKCHLGNTSNIDDKTVNFHYGGEVKQENTLTSTATIYTWSATNVTGVDFSTKNAMYVSIYASRSFWGSLTTTRKLYIAGATLEMTYDELVADPVPVITTLSQSTNKIGKDSECIVKFKSNMDLSQWEARAILSDSVNTSYAHGSGVLVESGESLSANTEAIVSVLTSELTNGDGNYVIYITGQSTLGEWSDE